MTAAAESLLARIRALHEAAQARDTPRLDELLAASSLVAQDELAAVVGVEAAAAYVARCAEHHPVRELIDILAQPNLATLTFAVRLSSALTVDDELPGPDPRLLVPELEARHAVGRIVAFGADAEDPVLLRGEWLFLGGDWRFLGLLRALVPYPATLPGLVQALTLGLVMAHGEVVGDLQALTGHFRLREPARFFAAHFSPASAAALAAEYAARAEHLGLEIASALHDCVASGRTQVTSEWIWSPYAANGAGYALTALRAMHQPVPLATVSLRAPGADSGFDIFSWAVCDGSFRLLGKLRQVMDEAPLALVLPGPTDASAAALRQLLVAATHLAGRGDAAALTTLAQRLLLPDPAAWFARAITEPEAAALTEAYGRVTGLERLFEALAHRSGLELEVHEVTGPDDEDTLAGVRAFCLARREPVTLYTVLHHGPEGCAAERTGAWTHEGGHFRYLGTLRALAGQPVMARWVSESLRYPCPENPRFPPTPEGLRALFDAMFASAAAATHDALLLQHYLASLRLPDPERWFRGTFVDPAATWPDYKGNPTTLAAALQRDAADDRELEELFARRPPDLEVRVHPLLAAADAPRLTGPAAMRRPTALHAVELYRPAYGNEVGMGLLPLVFDAGAWRLLGGLMNLDSVVARQYASLFAVS